MVKRVEVFYAGRVQGVGFRYATHQLARGFEVQGSVRNMPDGRVELVLEGEEEELRDFLEEVDESDLAGFIKERDVTWLEARGDVSGFRILT